MRVYNEYRLHASSGEQRRNSPLYRGVLREGFAEKRIMSSIMKNRSLPDAGVGEGKISRAEVARAEA